MAIKKNNRRLEKMPRKQHTGLYEVFNTTKKKYVKYNINLGAHIFHLSKKNLLSIKKISLQAGALVKNQYIKLIGRSKEFLKRTFGKTTNPFTNTKLFFKSLSFDYKHIKENDGSLKAFKYASSVISKQLFGSKCTLIKLVNYAAPVICFVFLVNLISDGVHTQYALSVECNGELLGYVSEESDFEEASQLLQDRITYVDGDHEVSITPKLSVQKVSSGQDVYSVNELTDKMLDNTDTPVIEAYGLYINDEFIGCTTTKSKIQATLDSMLDKYKTNDSNEKVSFVDDVEIKKGLYIEDGISSESEIISLLNSQKQVETYYTVKQGDSPSLVADNVGVSYSELKALNPSIETSFQIGDQILLNKPKPYLSVQVIKTEEYDITVDYETITTEDSTKYKGTQVITVEGSEGLSHVTAQVSYVDGYEASRDVIQETIIKYPINREISVGTKANGYSDAAWAASNGGFLWPVGGTGGYISSGFGGRYLYGKYNFHSGIDIAAPYGTNVYAAADGYVSKSSWYSGYGNCVMITHSNGFVTLYGHNSTLLVSYGQHVNKGDLIARVGSTGDSTGNHVHFEIRQNSVKLNPSNYVHH